MYTYIHTHTVYVNAYIISTKLKVLLETGKCPTKRMPFQVELCQEV
jgi:hypothetical protein